MKKVYELTYVVNGDSYCGGLVTIRIRAMSCAEAKHIAKRLTGCLIKDINLNCICGADYTATND